MKARVLVLTLCFAVQGCSFRAPQFEAALQMVRGGDDVEAEVAALAWTLEWLGDRETVYPVVIDERILFTNPADVQILFDGWQVLRVRELLPMRRVARIEVLEDREKLRFLEDEILLLETRCEPWRREPLQGGAFRWVQRCEELDEDNVMVVNAAGETQELRYVFHPAYPPIRIVKGGSGSP